MSTRSIFAVLAACVALSTGIGFAFGAASQPDSATAAKDSKVLMKINRKLTSLQGAVGVGDVGISSLAIRIRRIQTDADDACNAVDTRLSDCTGEAP